MRDMDEVTTIERIHTAAKNEFLKKGYKSAALRKIAEAAKVTTGALYGYYPDKISIFNSLVEKEAKTLTEWFRSTMKSFNNMPADVKVNQMHEYSEEKLLDMMDYIYDHYDAFKLIICCSEGTEYDGFIDVLADIEVEYSLEYFEYLYREGIMKKRVEKGYMHILENAYFSAIFETVVHDMTREDAKRYILDLTRFFGAGWDSVMGQQPEK